MDAKTLHLLFTQIIDGWDIPTASSVLRISSANATEKLPRMPYSITTNLAHAVLWQDHWLNALKGGRKNSTMAEWKVDFREASEDEFVDLRKRFMDGLEAARQRVKGNKIKHNMASDAEAADYLCRIAIHASYHIGQMNVIKRSKKQGTAKKSKT